MKGTRAVRAIAVDYYGTLVDVGRPFDVIRRWFASTYRFPPAQEQAFFMCFSKERARLQYASEFRPGYRHLLDSYEKACRRFQLPMRGLAFLRILAGIFTKAPAYPAAENIIRRLQASYPAVLLTNADNRYLYASIRRHEFSFDFILSSEDMCGSKPDQRMFSKACALLRTPPEEVLMIGDSLTEDVQGALSSGLQALWINRKGRPGGEGVPQVDSLERASLFLVMRG